jgi:serine/threonine protein phosphatase PrpC
MHSCPEQIRANKELFVNNFFDKLFGKKKQTQKKTAVNENVVTAPLSDAQLQAIKVASNKFEPAQIIVGCGQSVGKQRELNEDSLLAFTSTIAGNSGSTPFGLYIVADGMGGHQYGEVASNTAIRTIAGQVLRKFHPYLFDLPSTPLDESLQEIMQNAISEAQRVVLKEAPGSGTTVTAALVVGQQMVIAHVGDSRGYMIYQDGRVEVVTRDHSLVRRLEELGQITASEAAVHPQRNVLYRALGQGEILEPDITTMPFPQNGYLLLCSDGLWGLVSEEDIRQITLNAPTLHIACQNLVSAANAAGGPDNISAVMVQVLS